MLSFQIKDRKGWKYIVQVIYGPEPQDPEEVSDEDIKPLKSRACAPKKNKKLWLQSHKYATSMAQEGAESEEEQEEYEEEQGPSTMTRKKRTSDGVMPTREKRKKVLL